MCRLLNEETSAIKLDRIQKLEEETINKDLLSDASSSFGPLETDTLNTIKEGTNDTSENTQNIL